MEATGGAPQTGTTIVACCFDGGVVLGADTRVTTGAHAACAAPAPARRDSGRHAGRIWEMLPVHSADAGGVLCVHAQARTSATARRTRSRRSQTTSSCAAPARLPTRRPCPTSVRTGALCAAPRGPPAAAQQALRCAGRALTRLPRFSAPLRAPAQHGDRRHAGRAHRGQAGAVGTARGRGASSASCQPYFACRCF